MTALVAGTEHSTARGFAPESLRDYERAGLYRDLSVSWVMPLRDETVPLRVAGSWLTMQWPVNQWRSGLITEVGREVADAYNILIARCLSAAVAERAIPGYGEAIAKTHFILTTESDNIIPPKAVIQLFQAIYTCPDCGGEVRERPGGAVAKGWVCADGHRGYDAVSGLYFMKTDPPTPMAFGDPSDPSDFKPRPIRAAIESGATIEVNGIAMGIAVWRKDLFRRVSQPWFTTTQENTQDIWFCKKAKAETGARFGVHCGVQSGHLDVTSGVVF